MATPWNYYVKRRGINIEKLLRDNKCHNYKQLCAFLNQDDIEPPLEKELEAYFRKVKPRAKPQPKKQTLGTKSTTKSTSRHERARKSKIESTTSGGKESEQD